MRLTDFMRLIRKTKADAADEIRVVVGGRTLPIVGAQLEDGVLEIVAATPTGRVLVKDQINVHRPVQISRHLWRCTCGSEFETEDDAEAHMIGTD